MQSGIPTQTSDGSDWNQWQLDDTRGQLRTHLATGKAAIQLNMGYLVCQSSGSAQRGAFRGSSFERRTDAWRVLPDGERTTAIPTTTTASNC